MLRRTAVAPVLLSLALLSACGDDGLSKEDFVEQAEALCAEANTALEEEPEPEGPDEVGPYFETLLETADETTTELEELAADQPDEDELKEIFLDPLRGQVEELQDFLPQITEAAEQGEDAFNDLEEPDLPEADTDAMEEYGFDACVETAQAD